MGLMDAMKAANNYWAMVSCESGVGYLGPENLVDNRAKKLAIAIGTNVTVFGKADVKSIDVLFATSEWIKYSIVLKSGKRYVATFMALALDSQAGHKSAISSGVSAGKKVSMGLLNFESWMFDLLYKNVNVYNTAASATPQPTVAVQNGVKTVQNGAKTAAPTALKQSNVTKSAVKEEEVKKTSSDEEVQFEKDEEKEQQYLFGLQMMDRRSYEIAYNALSKIKGYKNVDALLEELSEKL